MPRKNHMPAFALLAGVIIAFTNTRAHAQTIISNETLSTSTLVVSKATTTAKCNTTGCAATKPMLTAIPVTCPAATGGTCTFHIALDSKIETSYPRGSFGGGPQVGLRFLVDGSAPSPGPTDASGNYLLGRFAFTSAENDGESAFARSGYTSSVVASVTNTTSNSHTIEVDLKCSDPSALGGCLATALSNTMRVDVFQP